MEGNNNEKVDTLLDSLDSLVEVAKANLKSLRKVLNDPNYMKNAIKSKELELTRNINKILSAFADIKRAQGDD